jgi:hypothetical protein
VHTPWADFFTKPLKPKQFTAMRNAIMNHRGSE